MRGGNSVRWTETCEASMFSNMGPFEVGNVVSPWFEVAVELEFIGRWYKAFEDGIDEGPEVIWVFRSSLEELLGLHCKVGVIFCDEEPTETM